MGEVFSKKNGLNNLFVGCRTMSRDEVYGARSHARFLKKRTGDFCSYINNSTGFGWEIVVYTENNRFWCSINFLASSRLRSLSSLKDIIRWRTEGK